ncbi:hypothetical protein H1C71_023669, partial [Ictidomys tridecemlineatus]
GCRDGHDQNIAGHGDLGGTEPRENCRQRDPEPHLPGQGEESPQVAMGSLRPGACHLCPLFVRPGAVKGNFFKVESQQKEARPLGVPWCPPGEVGARPCLPHPTDYTLVRCSPLCLQLPASPLLSLPPFLVAVLPCASFQLFCSAHAPWGPASLTLGLSEASLAPVSSA